MAHSPTPYKVIGTTAGIVVSREGDLRACLIGLCLIAAELLTSPQTAVMNEHESDSSQSSLGVASFFP